MHQEDWPLVSAFTFRLRGFSNRTAHYYTRAYQMELWKRVSHSYFTGHDDFCVGSVKRHKRTLNLINEFIDIYKNKPVNFISILHYLENSHDGNERAHHMDQDTAEFLDKNFRNGRFKNTASKLIYPKLLYSMV